MSNRNRPLPAFQLRGAYVAAGRQMQPDIRGACALFLAFRTVIFLSRVRIMMKKQKWCPRETEFGETEYWQLVVKDRDMVRRKK